MFTKPHDFQQLTKDYPELTPFLTTNKHNKLSLDFYDPEAVKVFNRVLLKHHYSIDFWDFPDGFLCPPVPGRADYLQAIYPMISNLDHQNARSTQVLDIGVGANCIYPLIGHQTYGWKFTGSDINLRAVQSARNIVKQNHLEQHIQIRHQLDTDHFFKGILNPDEYYDLTVCNPPYYTSEQEANDATRRRLKHKDEVTESSFAGSSNELWCEGGEVRFITSMIEESTSFSDQVGWFTVLVSKGKHLEAITHKIEEVGAVGKVFSIQRGQKVRRVVGWCF